MTKNLTICAAGLFLAASAPSQVRSVHPHFQHAQAVSDDMLASLDEIGPMSRKLPFETPTSIACIYHLIPNPAPGCPQSGTRELPTGGSGMIVIVNAYDDPAALHDLNFFSRRFGLPECNESNPCFQQVFATGRRPPLNALWAINAADISEYAHAFAPAAQIVLVEAQSGTNADLNFAIAFANQYVQKNSPTGTAQMILPWGDFESPDQLKTDTLLTAPGVIYISGNQFGFDVEYPASSPNVIGIGVTGTLRDQDGNFRLEYASSFDEGGVSIFEQRPSYQDAIAPLVGNHRGVPDVAMLSDPLGGSVILYTSIPLDNIVGWQFSGNVGVAEGILAAAINHAGMGRPNTAAELTALYNQMGDPLAFRDIVFGQAFGDTAKPGWDKLTGLGSSLGYLGK